jgi:hypothetical protein
LSFKSGSEEEFNREEKTTHHERYEDEERELSHKGHKETARVVRRLNDLNPMLRRYATRGTPLGAREPEIYRVGGTSVMVPDNLSWVDAVKDRVTVAKSAA